MGMDIRFSGIFFMLANLSSVLSQFIPSEILTQNTTFCRSNYYSWPECTDTPNGYLCTCGPGFYWNTKMCISDAVDSRLEFPFPILPQFGQDTKPVFAYTLLLGKLFPQLEQFTLSMHISPYPSSKIRRQCLFSYKYYKNDKIYIFSVFIGIDLELTIANETMKFNMERKLGKAWSHLIITWSSRTGIPKIYLNREVLKPANQAPAVTSLSKDSVIESGGLMVLGQFSPDINNIFALELSYVGSIAHVNIWEQEFDENRTSVLQNDCTFTHCGDGVEWVDIRSGTRGSSRLRWPSGIDGSNPHCFSKQQSYTSCDLFCSNKIGIQCKEEVQESIVWIRTPAVTPDKSPAIRILPCPGVVGVNNTDTSKANRTCTLQGTWGPPQVDNCLSPFFLSFSRKVKSYLMSESFDKKFMLELLTYLRNHTASWTYTNPIDLSSTVGLLNKLLVFQRRVIDNLLMEKSKHLLYEADFTLDDTIKMSDLYLGIVDDVISPKNDYGWNKTIPRGQEADELLQVIDILTDVVSSSFKYHFLNSEVTEPHYRKVLQNIAIKIEVMKKRDFIGVVFPDKIDVHGHHMSDEPGIITYVPKNRDSIKNGPDSDGIIAVSTVRLDKFSRLLYDPKFGKEDVINAPVVGFRWYGDKLPQNATDLRMKLSFVNTFNISNSMCLSIVHGNNLANQIWAKNMNACHSGVNDTKAVDCECSGQGFFTALTDMYNDNWYVPPAPPELMSIPSYLGCSISIFLNVCTLTMLIYVGTSSKTAGMHKQFAIAVTCNTTTFMIGITLTSNEAVCKAFAILFHFFFLAMFSWLMNEAFNLYVSITYTAHNQSTQENAVHWSNYLIGWAMPAVLVIALVASNFETYFSSDMCWISWDKIWLFTGPPLAMLCVMLLVMTFAVKENNEVSYTKNESANKITEYHSNAVWTQIILVTCTWAFGFLSLKFKTIVFKWVFFIFNSAQGAFIFVFFFLLNEEVRSVFKSKEIKQQLGWDVSADPYFTEDTIPLTSQGTKAEPAVAETELQETVTCV